ncbi:hypothetical protein [Paenibacillus amylolyticus]
MEHGDVSRSSGRCGVVAGRVEWTECAAMSGVKHAVAVKSGFMAGGSI